MSVSDTAQWARYLEPEIETMPRHELERRQADALIDQVSYWYEQSALVRHLWREAGVEPGDIRSLDDFTANAPFLSKDVIRQYRDETGDPYGGILCVEPSSLTAVFTSSGTTGDATFFPEQWAHGLAHLNVGRARALWGMGVRPGDIVVPSPPVTFRGPGHELAATVGAVPLIVNCWVGNWPEAFELFRAHRPAYMALSKPQLIDLVHESERYEIREIFSSFKAVSFAGEPLGAAFRERMVGEWDMNLFLWTSAGDVGFSFECEAHDGCHLWEDTLFAECLDPDGTEPVADGEVGELVVTAIADRTAPLVRYRTDDLVRLSKDQCGCGRTHVRQWPLGRKGDAVVVGGKVILPADVWSAIEQVPETADGVFQIVRPTREMSELHLRVGHRASAGSDLDGLSQRLMIGVAGAVGLTPRIELVDQDELLTRGTAATKTIPRVASS